MPAARLGQGDQEEQGGDNREIGAVVGTQVPPAPAEQRDCPGHEGGAVYIIAGEGTGEDGGGDDHGFEDENGQARPIIAPDIHHGDVLGGGGDEYRRHGVAGKQAEDPCRGEGDGTAQCPGHIGGEHRMFQQPAQAGGNTQIHHQNKRAECRGTSGHGQAGIRRRVEKWTEGCREVSG